MFNGLDDDRACDASVGWSIRELDPRSYDDLMQLARRVSSTREGARDLLHAALERALVAKDRFTSKVEMAIWLRRVMKNLEIDHHRHLKTRRSRAAQVRAEIYGQCESVDADGEQPLWHRLDRRDLAIALRSLKPRARQLLLLHHIRGWSYESLARHFRMAVGTVGTSLHRARRQAWRDYFAVKSVVPSFQSSERSTRKAESLLARHGEVTSSTTDRQRKVGLPEASSRRRKQSERAA